MPDQNLLIELLADGRFHSGEALGHELGISRAAVWKAIRSLQPLGLDIQAVPGRGYRLARTLELLDAAQIPGAMGKSALGLLGALEIHRSLESTNRYLMERAAELDSGHVCFAERQHSGRGRRGRVWVSPFGCNIYLSVLWHLEGGSAALAGLSLALGVAVIHALTEVGVETAGLKWPNDILWNDRKLGGLLVEISGEAGGPCAVVTGVGLNVQMPRGSGESIGQPWTDLNTVLGGDPVSRNRLAGLLLDQILPVLSEYAETGLEPYLEEWRQRDVCMGRRVLLSTPAGQVSGEACGIDRHGALLLKNDSGLLRYDAGEVSLRPDETGVP